MADLFPHTIVQCLAAIAQSKGIRVTPERLIHDFALTNAEPETPLVVRMAGEIGLEARGQLFSWEDITRLEGVFPFIARLKDGAGIIIVGVEGPPEQRQVAIVNPQVNAGDVCLLSQAELEAMWSGEVVFLKRSYALLDENQPFGLRWFIPEIFKQRKAFRDVIIAAFAMNLLALASPMFFQLVIDKVLVHQTSSTLVVLTIGVSVALLFDSVFSYIRQILLLAATNKIDMRVTRRVFRQLLSLPIDFFETSTAGVVTRKMQQLEGVRHFLTGRLMFSVMDALALVIFLPLLFTYSVTLALIVLGFTLAMMLIIVALLPTFRERLDKLNTAEGMRQALLVETIHGMRTVKALAIEPSQRKTWDQLSANSINANYSVMKLGITGNTATELLAKFMPIVIIFVGAQGVFDQTITVGVLVAFQMLSGRVVGPLVQIVGLINEYQQTIISVNMLADIMNRPSEGRIGGGGVRPQLKGKIAFEEVTFRYPGSSINALNKMHFTIEPGTIVGIVGRSGSGKTTLTKLIQGLYPIQEGVIRFDGIDAREIDLAHLRKHIGVVLQENFLFRGTIRENLTVSKPDATDSQIIAAAQAAGATEFIERLPQGYDTMLEENAANLSGGQKQRLSIARAILANPNILILDEAASALDPESETIFINNLSQIAVGRTVIMVSHRLSTLVNADRILVMQNGQLSDNGKHSELLQRCETYQTLWNQQTSHL